jgi:hypothetical protein
MRACLLFFLIIFYASSTSTAGPQMAALSGRRPEEEV